MPPVTCPACGCPLAEAAAPCPQCQRAPTSPAPPAHASPATPVAAAWDAARAAFARYAYAATVDACAQVLALAPAHEEAAHLKVQAEQKQQAKDAALQLANGYFNKGQYELALVHFNTVLTLAPTDEDVRRKQEMAKLLSGQDLTAYTPRPIRRMTATWADEVVPSPVSTMVMAGVILAGVVYLFYYAYARTQKHHLAAEQLYRQVKQQLVVKEYLTVQSQESYHQLTTVYGNTSFAKDAVEMLAKTRARKLAEAPRQLDQAEALLETNEAAQALELARDVLHWDPKNNRARAVIARAEDVVRQLEERYMQQAVNGGVRRPVATAADAAASSEAPAAAAAAPPPDLLEQQDDNLSPDVKKLVVRGQDRFNVSDYAAAAFLWEKALARHGRPHQILQRLVHQAHLLDERERRRFEGARARAAALEAARQWPQALAAYREAQIHRPADADVAQQIATLEGRLALTLDASAAPSPRSTIAQQVRAQRWRSEASYHEQAGEWREAAKASRKVLASAPDPALRRQLYTIQFIDAEERRRARHPGVPDAERDLALAEAYLTLGKPAQARQLLHTLLSSVPQERKSWRAVLQALIGQAYADEQSDTDAIAAYRQSVAQAPVWCVQHSLATTLWRNGQFLEAMRMWERTLQQTPKQVDVIASLASGYVLMDLPAKAQALLAPLQEWNAGELRQTQRYPPAVRPEYWMGTVQPRELLAEVCDHVAQTWVLLDQPLESLRWRQLAQAERDDQAQAERRAMSSQHAWWRFWSR